MSNTYLIVGYGAKESVERELDAEANHKGVQGQHGGVCRFCCRAHDFDKRCIVMSSQRPAPNVFRSLIHLAYAICVRAVSETSND